MVRNEEKKAFRDMTTGDRVKIMEAWIASGIEAWTGYAWSGHSDYVSYLYDKCIYRTKTRQPVIPWEVIKPEYKWAAMDMDGEVYVFIGKPEVCGDMYWHHEDHITIDALNIDTAGIDWRESLTERPEGV